jgi:hypothetical protein
MTFLAILGPVYGAWIGGKFCQKEECLKLNSAGLWAWEPTKKIFKPDRFANWSQTGGNGQRQPDSLTSNEQCLANLNDWYQDGVAWHDFMCSDTLPFICQTK